MSDLRIKKESISSFFLRFESTLGKVLSIPDYQREYVWSNDNFSRLAEDLTDFIKIEDENRPNEYYLGNIVLHEDKKEINIVDGQQRITTILIINFVINKDQSILKKGEIELSFLFKSKISRKNIKNCQHFFEEYLTNEERKKCLVKAIEKVIFVTITTSSPDEAFTMFDTQNNRGIKPKVADLLKAVHLRSIINDENLQDTLAKNWEHIEKYEKEHPQVTILPWNKTHFMLDLINTMLWRARTWRYGSYSFAWDDGVEKEFFRDLKDVQLNTIKVFSGTRKFAEGEINCSSDGNCFVVKSYSIPKSPKDYPISVRQPLERGVTFFIFIEKYFETLQYIFTDRSQEKFQEFFDTLYRYQSDYMKQAFVVASLVFVDKFGFDNLLRFAKYWDYATGHLRQFSYRIRMETYPNYIAQQQLFDKIFNSYTENELFRQLLDIKSDFKIKSISAPMRKYHKACIDYYQIVKSEIPDDFKNDYLKKRKLVE